LQQSLVAVTPRVVRDHTVQLALSLRVTIAAVASFALSEGRFPPAVVDRAHRRHPDAGELREWAKATTDYLASTICGAAYACVVAVLWLTAVPWHSPARS
jgi:hypothetical protein